MTKILFITATRIGDAVLYSGVLDHLIATYEDAEITVACGPLAAPLFRATPKVRRLVVMTKQKRAGHWFNLWNQTRGTHWDMVIDLRSSLTSWFLRTRSRFINRRTPGVAHRHRVVEAAGVLGLDHVPAPRLWLDDAAKQLVRDALPADKPVLALSPSAAAPFKQWPAEQFAALTNQLTGPSGALAGARVALFGGPGDEARSEAVAHDIHETDVIDLTGRLGILESGAALARARLFIGNDSGLMHMAAAAGVPTLGLFGPTDENVYGPWGAMARSVRVGDAADENERGKLRFSETSLMQGLTIDAVLEAAQSLISETKDHSI